MQSLTNPDKVNVFKKRIRKDKIISVNDVSKQKLVKAVEQPSLYNISELDTLCDADILNAIRNKNDIKSSVDNNNLNLKTMKIKQNKIKTNSKSESNDYDSDFSEKSASGNIMETSSISEDETCRKIRRVSELNENFDNIPSSSKFQDSLSHTVTNIKSKKSMLTETTPPRSTQSNTSQCDFYDTINFPFLKPKKTVKAISTENLNKTVSTENYWGVLENQKIPESQPGTSKQSITTGKSNLNTEKIPPIIMNGKLQDYTGFIDKVKNTLNHSNFHIAFNSNSIKIMTRSKLDHSKVCDKLVKDNQNFHTFGYRDEKTKKLILKAAPNMRPNDIKVDLELNDGISVENVHPLTGKNPINFSYLVSFSADTNLRNVLQINNIGHLRIKWEQFVKKFNYVQCYRCQSYGHTQNYCGAKPNCVKCAGPHNTKECNIVERNNNPKCSNCGGSHTANYSQCPALLKYLEARDISKTLRQEKIQKTTLQPNREKQQTYYKKSTDGPSYAEIAQGKNNYPKSNFQTQNSDEVEDFNTLLKEVRELNNVCNIRQMIELIRNIKSDMLAAHTPLDKLNVLGKYVDKF